MIKYKILIIMALFNSTVIAEMNSVDYYNYTILKGPYSTPIQGDYLKLDRIPMATSLDKNIRQPINGYPGDYFWPPDALTPRKFINPQIIKPLSTGETAQFELEIKSYINIQITDSIYNAAIKGYSFDYPDGYHREAYGMFVDGDTVYVISGWLGKFISFYRVVPGDFRLSTSELMKELDKITPLSKGLRGKEDAFRHEADSTNYLLEFIEREGMFRVRNYLMKTILPPSPPDGPEQFYNLIEVTKFYDKEAIP